MRVYESSKWNCVIRAHPADDEELSDADTELGRALDVEGQPGEPPAAAVTQRSDVDAERTSVDVPRKDHPDGVVERVRGVGGLRAVWTDDDHVGHVAASSVLVHRLRLVARHRRCRRCTAGRHTHRLVANSHRPTDRRDSTRRSRRALWIGCSA